MLAFDVETGPLADAELTKLLPPFEAPPHPGEFDPGAVKCGNLKDPAKIQAKVCEAREAHVTACERYESDVRAAREKHFADFKSRAALDATTGHVVAIGWTLPDGDGPEIIDCDRDEAAGLRRFWFEVQDAIQAALPLIGFNVCHFDLPFLIRRSWILGVPVPMGLRKGRYWADSIIDLMQVWGFHGRELVKLDTIAKAFGLAGKVQEVNGAEVSGADFHRLWRENRAAAEAYLRQDVLLCVQLAERMGVV